MEQQAFSSKIQELKLRVKEMLNERTKLNAADETSFPAPLWAEATSVFSYLMNLSDIDFRNIRFHTGLISGESWQYWGPYPEPDPEATARNLGYIEAIKGVPIAYWIGEPPTPGIPRPLGVNYRGNIINSNTVRFQQCISHLYHAGALRSVLEASKKQLIVEIGGGYGALAHHLSRILGKKATYVIVDLPDLFLFSGAFLAVNNPEKSIYIYDSKTFTPDFTLTKIYEYDFVLIPNYALNRLHAIQEIALMINMQSFQEMSSPQVKEYLEFGAKRVSQYLFSDNVDRHPHNHELGSLSTILENYFDLYPSPGYYDSLFKDTNQHWTNYYRKYLGIPKGSGRTFQGGQVKSVPVEPEVSPVRRSLRILVPLPLRRLAIYLLKKIAGA